MYVCMYVCMICMMKILTRNLIAINELVEGNLGVAHYRMDILPRASSSITLYAHCIIHQFPYFSAVVSKKKSSTFDRSKVGELLFPRTQEFSLGRLVVGPKGDETVRR